LNQKYPTCINFLIKSGGSIFFGSTPELLAQFSDNQFFTEALAGSIKRGDNLNDDKRYENELFQSKKNKVEHDAVTNYIISSLKDFLEDIDINSKPVIKKLPNIQHLQTAIKGTLKPDKNIFEIISALFPTPAVCGIPQDKSLQLIREAEDFDRGLYSGLIGWFNCKGYGEFSVAIRSSLINNNQMYLYAGCGIVEDSDPTEEFEESKLKLRSILSLFDDAT
jgi:menaquinone-specific isochorismate synthase